MMGLDCAMIESVMRECHNFFERVSGEGTFVIQNGSLTDTDEALPVTGFVAITGSAFNDGVHRIDAGDMIDETFTGRVWILHPPKSFLDLCAEIGEFEAKNPVGSPVSESFGPYSHTRGTGANGGAMTWQEAYGRRLAPYRRMFTEVNL